MEEQKYKTGDFIALARDFGAAVERAKDGKYNFFTHPNNCAFGQPLPQSEGEFSTSKAAWIACGKHLIESGKSSMPEQYQGWTNSATFLANQYVIQEQRLHEGLVLAITTEGEKADLKKVLKNRFGVTVVKNKTEDEDEDIGCGYMKRGLCVRLDHWAQGDINWTEIRNNLAADLGIALTSGKTKATP